MDRSWLLPVLKENIQFSTLEYFLKGILPLAMVCHQKSQHLAQTHNGIAAHSYELLYSQLWNLLPSFCNNPIDVKENFKSIARILGTYVYFNDLATKPDILIILESWDGTHLVCDSIVHGKVHSQKMEVYSYDFSIFSDFF